MVKGKGKQEQVSYWFLVFVLSCLHKSSGNDSLTLSLDLEWHSTHILWSNTVWSKQINTGESHIYCRSSCPSQALVKNWFNLEYSVNSKYGNVQGDHVIQGDLISFL